MTPQATCTRRSRTVRIFGGRILTQGMSASQRHSTARIVFSLRLQIKPLLLNGRFGRDDLHTDGLAQAILLRGFFLRLAYSIRELLSGEATQLSMFGAPEPHAVPCRGDLEFTAAICAQ